jgi:hypothetical protein
LGSNKSLIRTLTRVAGGGGGGGSDNGDGGSGGSGIVMIRYKAS